MKIAIHKNDGSFSHRWIQYCQANNVPHKIVNCYDSDIIEQLDDCNALMWHHHQSDFRDVLFAKGLLTTIELTGKSVFPDLRTGWHFDDKIAQKYLLESINAPIVPSFVFYDKAIALSWAKATNYPKVFKLRRGAGATNVKLVPNYRAAEKLINKAFGKGFSPFNAYMHMMDAWEKYRRQDIELRGVFSSFRRFLLPKKTHTMMARERGYIYFQDFVPKNKFDIRVVVIGNRAFAIKRLVRENDFRASGSGLIIYDHEDIPKGTINVSFEVAQRLESQCIGFDFVYESNTNPKIVEISYGFSVEGYDNCPGYWDENLNWYQTRFNPQEWMIENVLKHAKQTRA